MKSNLVEILNKLLNLFKSFDNETAITVFRNGLNHRLKTKKTSLLRRIVSNFKSRILFYYFENLDGKLTKEIYIHQILKLILK